METQRPVRQHFSKKLKREFSAATVSQNPPGGNCGTCKLVKKQVKRGNSRKKVPNEATKNFEKPAQN